MTLLVVGPLLGPGYLLLRDAVSTPRSFVTDAALGLGDAAPRAVPQDAVLAVLSPIVDGGVLVKAILVLALWAAGYGAAVLVRELLRVGVGPQLVATTVALWNPYVAERLLQGHWSLLAGYAALPWTALAAYRLRCASQPPPSGSDPGGSSVAEDARRWWGATGSAGAWGALAACFAAAGLTPTGALLAGLTALVTVRRAQIPGTLLLLALASAPWLVATVLSGAGAEPSDPVGIAAFAARAEPGLATLGSLAGLGGIWNADAVPGSRTTLLALVGTIVLLAIVATGVRAVADGRMGTSSRPGSGRCSQPRFGHSDKPRPGHFQDASRVRIRRALLLLAVGAVLLPALAATGCGREVMEWLVVQVPGAGLLRDTQKYVALAVPGYALCAAAGCHAFARRLSDRTADGDEIIGSSAESSRFEKEPEAQRDEAKKSRLGKLSTDIPKPLGTTSRIEDSEESRHTSAVSKDQGSNGGNPTDRALTQSPSGTALIATVFIALLILPLADLAWGVGGALRPVHYPHSWQHVAEKVDGPGDVAVLPGGMFRKFPYSGKAPVLDPAPRMLPNDVLQTGELPVRGAVVSGEGKRAQQAETLLLQGGSAEQLAALGVGWVLVERTTPGPLGESKNTIAQLDPVYVDSELALYRVPGTRVTEAEGTQRLLAGAAHILWAGMLFVGLAAGLARRNQSEISGGDR
ncbi:hypothetical protein GCM10027088_27610 [Nocardia goodfellowii]|uniref:Transmembrane protein n=1 Tax=Nocardia goodfellowii TaxID=882446 RepID=A0ABS4QCL7_9NOCA|nr:hypothetical protein [Nocardia goodfellowii]MBP2188441.1 hypothetical protein [Nocardia goodfellowii]